MKCPIMYEPGKWALIEVRDKDLESPVLQLAFRGPDEQVKLGYPRTMHSMTTYEAKTFQRIDLMLKGELHHIYIPA